MSYDVVEIITFEIMEFRLSFVLTVWKTRQFFSFRQVTYLRLTRSKSRNLFLVCGAYRKVHDEHHSCSNSRCCAYNSTYCIRGLGFYLLDYEDLYA